MQLAAVLPAKGHNQDFKAKPRRVESKIPYCVIGFSGKLPLLPAKVQHFREFRDAAKKNLVF